MRGNLVMDIHGMYLDQNTGQPSILTPYPSVLDFSKIKFEKSS